MWSRKYKKWTKSVHFFHIRIQETLDSRERCDAAEARTNYNAVWLSALSPYTRARRHRLQHRALRAADLAARLNPFDEVGEITVEQLLGYVRRNGVHAPSRASTVAGSCRHEPAGYFRFFVRRRNATKLRFQSQFQLRPAEYVTAGEAVIRSRVAKAGRRLGYLKFPLGP